MFHQRLLKYSIGMWISCIKSLHDVTFTTIQSVQYLHARLWSTTVYHREINVNQQPAGSLSGQSTTVRPSSSPGQGPNQGTVDNDIIIPYQYNIISLFKLYSISSPYDQDWRPQGGRTWRDGLDEGTSWWMMILQQCKVECELSRWRWTKLATS